jgi:hypothetical protein
LDARLSTIEHFCARLIIAIKGSRIFASPSENNTLDSQDLQTMQEKIEHFNSENTYIVGHCLQMIEDAERIKETFYLTLSLYN